MALKAYQAFGQSVLHQVMVHILPVYIGQFISMVKMTSAAGYISVQNLTKMSDIICSSTYEDGINAVKGILLKKK